MKPTSKCPLVNIKQQRTLEANIINTTINAIVLISTRILFPLIILIGPRNVMYLHDVTIIFYKHVTFQVIGH